MKMTKITCNTFKSIMMTLKPICFSYCRFLSFHMDHMNAHSVIKSTLLIHCLCYLSEFLPSLANKTSFMYFTSSLHFLFDEIQTDTLKTVPAENEHVCFCPHHNRKCTASWIHKTTQQVKKQTLQFR